VTADDGWSDKLVCPLCGCGEVVIVADQATLPGFLHGRRIEACATLPGRAVCRNERCGAEFEYYATDEADS
jgi:hypothetical protein